jgi:hypothetical protein
VHPSPHTSIANEYCFIPSITSGARYHKVCTSLVSRLCFEVTYLANPKSPILAFSKNK